MAMPTPVAITRQQLLDEAAEATMVVMASIDAQGQIRGWVSGQATPGQLIDCVSAVRDAVVHALMAGLARRQEREEGQA